MTQSAAAPHQRRTDTEKHQIGDYYSGTKRYYDQNFEVTVVKIFSGECYVTSNPGEMIVTILGSCIAACIRDPVTKVGGMNHFLLPEDKSPGIPDGGNRYGVNAMEYLINEILKRGGMKNRLEVKVFGGGNVTDSTARIGSQNAAFVRGFLAKEGLTITAEDLEGDYPRRLHYFPDTGKIMMRKLRRKGDLEIVNREKAYQKSLATQPVEGDIELFD